MSFETFLSQAKDKFGTQYDYSKTKYTNDRSPIIITCPVHGDFNIIPRNFLKGRGCPKCWREERSLKDTFEIKANKVHNFKYDYSKVIYTNNKRKIEIICPKHVSFWQNVQSHLKGFGCPQCSKEHYKSPVKLDTSIFVSKANLIHNNYYDYSKVNYTLGTEYVTIICPKHGEFQQRPTIHLSGSGCPKCNSSKGELRILQQLSVIFPDLEVKHHFTAKWLGRQHLDIYIPTYNIGIEYNGKQHYVPIPYSGGDHTFINTRKRDYKKLHKCMNNNCKLFIVRYDKYDEDLHLIIDYIQKFYHKNDN